MEFNEAIAHITCNLCGKRWQVLNEECTDWDEAATAEQYHAEQHDCQNVVSNPEELWPNEETGGMHATRPVY